MGGADRPAALEVRGLVKRYGDVVALGGVDLTVTTGVHALLGPNGAGKTTLLRIVATVLAPDAGRVSVLGRDPAEDLRWTRERLGYVPQDAGAYPHFRVGAFVDYVALLRGRCDRGERAAAVERALGAVDLAAERRRRVRELSGGQRRRLGIAQALLGDPDLLVLDEPFVGLDPGQRLHLRSLLVALGERAAVLVSTHQTEDVAHLAATVTVLDGGRTRFEGSPDDLAGAAEGRVWIGDRDDPSDFAAALAGDRYRHVGTLPPGRTAERPTVEDGYLCVLGRALA